MSPPKPRSAGVRRPATGGAASKSAGAAVPTLRLRVTLIDVEPAVRREVLVPVDLTFAQLHQVLQAAMGWEDYHMHEFEVGEVHIGLPVPKDFFAGDSPLLDERKTRLGDVLDGRRKFRYWYDFGDDWWHEIAIRNGAADEGGGPRLLAGDGACPPEDCGGPYGYAALLQALADPKHPEHEELREWAGDFDPQRFDFDRAAKNVAKAVRRTSPRK
jgi:pRiA4b ORF-3-like protein